MPSMNLEKHEPEPQEFAQQALDALKAGQAREKGTFLYRKGEASFLIVVALGLLMGP